MVSAPWQVGLLLVVITPSQVRAQAPREGPSRWSALSQTWPPAVADSVSPTERSAAKTIALHGAVGTGAGLLIGLLLSGANTGDDNTTVVVTWTALGAAAGVISGVVTWLVGRGQ